MIIKQGAGHRTNEFMDITWLILIICRDIDPFQRLKRTVLRICFLIFLDGKRG